MSEDCLICKTTLTTKPEQPDEGQAYECPRCGKYLMSTNTEKSIRGYPYNEEQIAILSHAIRKMQRQDSLPEINPDLITAILKNPLPNPIEQANNLIIWFAENVSLGEKLLVQPSTHQSIIGAKSPDGFALILKYLFERGVFVGNMAEAMGAPGRALVTLSFDGWQYYDQLKRGAVDSRKAFMAMEYGDEQLDRIVENYFKPAVADTGFELCRLDEPGKAGLIDDHMIVEIRNSRFLISDLTHENRGAYWEAGYAEGLGKPVIYTCEKKKFEENKTHFDTNHHLTVTWDEKELQEAMETLKATIRATLPDEAKLSDG